MDGVDVQKETNDIARDGIVRSEQIFMCDMYILHVYD
jgi:hypothetical protein